MKIQRNNKRQATPNFGYGIVRVFDVAENNNGTPELQVSYFAAQDWIDFIEGENFELEMIEESGENRPVMTLKSFGTPLGGVFRNTSGGGKYKLKCRMNIPENTPFTHKPGANLQKMLDFVPEGLNKYTNQPFKPGLSLYFREPSERERENGIRYSVYIGEDDYKKVVGTQQPKVQAEAQKPSEDFVPF